ncbi:MAG: hypothetical protein JWM78_3464 [Verrucomicrobiaceae bacterium]|nr:hypothetical protein [Verrucomicrobiaceae bacterium]
MKPPKRPNKPATDDVLDEATVAKLADAVSPVSPPPELAARMRERVMETAQLSATEVVRAEEGEWKKILPGIRIKTLHLDIESGTQTSLWRLEAGARVPPHPHSKDEECLILEGTITHDGNTYGQGDYLYASPGIRHRDFISPTGALILIRGERIPSKLLLNLAMLLPH